MDKPCTRCGHIDMPEPHSCADCGTKLERVFPEYSSAQYINALEINFGGGYGMFFDDFDGNPQVYLCHDCAHRLCASYPWLERLLQPENSHSHSKEFWESHNEHHGWDRPDE